MSRPRAFEMDEALARALEVFWSRGYQAASMTELLTAMGLSKSSFYAAFGSKRDVFLAALDRYSQSYLEEVRDRFGCDGDGLRLLRDYLGEVVLGPGDAANRRRGCMMVNVAVQLAPDDRAIEAEVRRHVAALRAFLSAMIRRAQAQGTVSPVPAPETLARQLLAVIVGVTVLKKGGMATDDLLAIIEAAVATLAVGYGGASTTSA
ncbi:MAG: TetR/AcrR family transcriptional regulator [Azospirillaceae bacterium]|nr:TetR/AcrR family transcriptional regulator [Azospirillaceae bacterium]